MRSPNNSRKRHPNAGLADGIFVFTLTTFLGAWLIVTSTRVKAGIKTIQEKLANKKR